MGEWANFILNKQEFAELKLPRTEMKQPMEILYKAKKIIARFISRPPSRCRWPSIPYVRLYSQSWEGLQRLQD